VPGGQKALSCSVAWRLLHKPPTDPVRRSVMGRPMCRAAEEVPQVGGGPRQSGWNRDTSPTSEVPKLFDPFVQQPPWNSVAPAAPLPSHGCRSGTGSDRAGADACTSSGAGVSADISCVPPCTSERASDA